MVPVNEVGNTWEMSSKIVLWPPYEHVRTHLYTPDAPPQEIMVSLTKVE